MISRLPSRNAILLSLLLLSISSAGCASFKQTVIHPIEKSDIFAVDKGTKVGDLTAEKDGWFISDLYLKEVMDAKVK